MSYYSKLFWGEVAGVNGGYEDDCRYMDEIVEFASEFGYAQPAIGWDENTWNEALEFIVKMDLGEQAGKLIHSLQLEEFQPYGHF